MAEIEDMDAAEALDAIREAVAQNPDAPGEPEALDLAALQTVISLFQPRDITYREGEDEAHLKVLAKAVGNPAKPNHLGRITVWWAGHQWVILDGHHRREAYRRAGVRKGIPVRVFHGTLDEAMAEAVSLNSKDKMPMRLPEKMNKAWQLVVCTQLRKGQIVNACAVSDGSVASMRRIRKDLENLQKTVPQMLEMSWEQARLEAEGKSKQQVDYDEALELRARGYARALAKALGDRPHRDPEGFALALLKLDSRLPGSLMESQAWGDAVEVIRDERASLAQLEDEHGDY